MVRAWTLARASWDQNGESGEVELETLTLALCCDVLYGHAAGLFCGLPCWWANSLWLAPWRLYRAWGRWSAHVSALHSFPK